MSTYKILIAGCGDVGGTLGNNLAAQGHTVYGLRRNINQLPASIHGISADLAQPDTLNSLPEALDILIYAVAAGSREEQRYRQAYPEGLRNLLDALQQQAIKPKQLFFVSSTAVYQQADHQWIDETSATEPEGFSGQVMLEAEQIALNSDIPGCVVRFSGIYGPGRNFMLNQVNEGRGYPQSPMSYSNRIHRDDCVGVLQHLINQVDQSPLQPIYLASDCQPAPLFEVTEWLASQLGVSITEHSARRAIGSKRCNNQRLLDSGYQFKYPTYQTGYRSLITAFRKNR